VVVELLRHHGNKLRAVMALAADIDTRGIEQGGKLLAEAKACLDEAGRTISAHRKTVAELEAQLGGTLQQAQAEHDWVTGLFMGAVAALEGATKAGAS
jgi:hypothetical protein